VTEDAVRARGYANPDPKDKVFVPDSKLSQCEAGMQLCFSTYGASLMPTYHQYHKYLTQPLFYVLVNGVTQGVNYQAMAAQAGVTYVFSYVYLFFIPVILYMWMAFPRNTMHIWVRAIGVIILYGLMISEIVTFMVQPLVTTRFAPMVVNMSVTIASCIFSMFESSLFMLPVSTFVQVFMLSIGFYA
jgi:hypothetical protein